MRDTVASPYGGDAATALLISRPPGIAGLQAGVDRAYRQLIDGRADLAVASANSDVDVVATAKDCVDEVAAMFASVSMVNVAEMMAAIEQGLSNLEAAIALIPPDVEPPPVERDRTRREDRAGCRRGVGPLGLVSTPR